MQTARHIFVSLETQPLYEAKIINLHIKLTSKLMILLTSI